MDILLEHFNDKSLHFTNSPPKYLLPFLEDEEIVFVCKKAQVISTGTIINESTGSDTDTTEELTGQPLECPFSINESDTTELIPVRSKEKDNYYPLSIHEARKIVSFARLNILFEKPLYILTDGCNNTRTILLGTEKDGNWYSRSWATVNRDCFVDVSNMIQNHNVISLIDPIQMKSEVSCMFLIESADDNPATFLQVPTGHLELHLSWKSPTLFVPLNEANAKITIETCIGHEESEISELWHHVTLLYDYVHIIQKWKTEKIVQEPYSHHTVKFPNMKQFSDHEGSLISVLDQLVKLLNDANYRVGTMAPRNDEHSYKGLPDMVKNFLESKPKEQEFTDKLWNLLVECETYQELCTCIETVFQYVRDGICKPFLRSTNICRLAQVLKHCKADPTSRFGMLLEPLELLVEIGIEKLKKNYIGLYLMCKLATSEQLEIPSLPKFSEVNMTNWIENCSKWIMWFLKVHVVLQASLLTASIVNSESCIVPITGIALSHYLSNESPIVEFVDPRTITTQLFTACINTKDIQELIERKPAFNNWTLKLKSETENRRVTSVYHRAADNLFPSSISLLMDPEKYFFDLLKEKSMSPGIAAIKTLLHVLKSDNKSETVQELDSNFQATIEILRKTDIPVASVASASELFLRFITFAILDYKTFEKCKSIMLDRGEIFVKKLLSAREKIARLSATFITDGSKILVHSHSRAILEAIQFAVQLHRRFEVFVTSTTLDDSGKEMHDEVEKLGVPCTMILDAAVGYIMEQIDLVMVGAEAVVESGGIINKIGSFTIAVCAKEMKKPFYVLTESFKFTRLFPLNQRDLPDDFKYTSSDLKNISKAHPLVDYTPPSFITLLFTDLGILTPSAVSDELIKLYL